MIRKLSEVLGLLPPDVFQSTCLREARQAVTTLGVPAIYFNPRAYVRHDHESGDRVRPIVFQSTCLREARPAGDGVDVLREISIHVPT